MKTVLSFLMLSLPHYAFALAPAVNGGALIDGPSRVEADFALKHSDVLASVKPSGERRANQDHESIRNGTLRAAAQLPSAVQLGTEIQLVDRTRAGAGATSLSELNFDGGYRAGPVLTYLQLTVPVSRSAYEKEDQYQINALGRGFWAVGVGQYWRFARDGWSAFATYEVHRSFARAFANADNRGTLAPGYGFNWSAGAGYTFGRVTGGLAISQSYEDPVARRGDRSRDGGSAQRFFTPGVSVGVELDGGWTVGVAYADQTILPAATADLVREIGLSVARSWR